MEKYARQALSEGVKQADELTVTADSELLRVLNLHYNRNNHIEVRTVLHCPYSAEHCPVWLNDQRNTEMTLSCLAQRPS